MSNRRTIALLVGWLALGFFRPAVQAQEDVFRQYRMAPLSLNPAEVAASPNWRAIAHYRRQQMAGDVGFRSTQFSLMRPLYWGNRRYAGVGASVLDDRSADPGWFRFQRVGLSAAYQVPLVMPDRDGTPLGRRQYLSFGLQTDFQRKRITTDNVRTGSQFRPGQGFDPAVDSGEGVNGVQTSYFSVNAGGLWYATDRHERTVAYAGISLFQLNRPRDTFFAPANPLPVEVKAYGGWQLLERERGSVSPELLWQYQAGQHLLNVGARFAYQFKAPAQAGTAPRLEVVPRYTLNRNAFLAVQWHTEDYTVGVSYDTDASFNASENPLRSAFELVVAWHPPVEPKKRDRRSKGPKWVLPPSLRKVPRVTPQPLVTENELPAVSRTVPALAAVEPPWGGSLAVRSLTLTVEFAFDRAALTSGAEETLEDIVLFLKQPSDLKVILTGHADGLGTPEANERISWARAQAVRDYLLRQGIAAERIEVRARGAKEPLYPNTLEALRAKNRRVEVGFLPR